MPGAELSVAEWLAAIAQQAQNLRAAQERVQTETAALATLVQDGRGAGVMMIDMALAAGFTDSYLSRIAIRRGAPRLKERPTRG